MASVVDEFINWPINVKSRSAEVFGQAEQSRTSVTLLLVCSVREVMGGRLETGQQLFVFPTQVQKGSLITTLDPPSILLPRSLAFLQLLFSPEFGIQSRNRHDKHYFSFPWRPGPAIKPGLHASNAKTAWPTFPPSYKNKMSLSGSCESWRKSQSSCYLSGHFEEEQILITFENSVDATEPLWEVRHELF